MTTAKRSYKTGILEDQCTASENAKGECETCNVVMMVEMYACADVDVKDYTAERMPSRMLMEGLNICIDLELFVLLWKMISNLGIDPLEKYRLYHRSLITYHFSYPVKNTA